MGPIGIIGLLGPLGIKVNFFSWVDACDFVGREEALMAAGIMGTFSQKVSIATQKLQQCSIILLLLFLCSDCKGVSGNPGEPGHKGDKVICICLFSLYSLNVKQET